MLRKTCRVIGGAFFVLVRERLAANLTDVHQVIFGVLFVLVVLLLPGGLLEIWDRSKRIMAKRQTKKLQATRGAEDREGGP